MRIVVLVIDSFGIGALPDAEAYGDAGSNTAGHIAETVSRDIWPNLKQMGLGNSSVVAGHSLTGCEAVAAPTASYGVMAERSAGKDTTTGHWELSGVVLDEPFFTFPKTYPSFPNELLDPFIERIGSAVLGNYAASGTVIIEELGGEHLRTRRPIVYTSGDSVFQIAAHEEVVPIDELYQMCEVARELCDPYRVGRVIARPFIGTEGAFIRTSGRRDFSMEPTGETVLDRLCSEGIETVGIGKIGDIFTERGVVVSHHDKGNAACLDRLEALLAAGGPVNQFVFVNLVDTDMIYGHRRDPVGYADAVNAIDSRLPDLIDHLSDDDALIVTADHGCDPTFRGTDHTREYVPILWFQRGRRPKNLGARTSFADLAQSIAARFGTSMMNGFDFF